MTRKQALLAEIDRAPLRLLEELWEALHALKEQTLRRAGEPALASEAVLSKDWLRPEEDEAWGDL